MATVRCHRYLTVYAKVLARTNWNRVRRAQEGCALGVEKSCRSEKFGCVQQAAGYEASVERHQLQFGSQPVGPESRMGKKSVSPVLPVQQGFGVQVSQSRVR